MTPNIDAISLVRNTIDRAIARAEHTIQGVSSIGPHEVLKDLRELEQFAKVLTDDPQDTARLAGLRDTIDRLGKLPSE